MPKTKVANREIGVIKDSWISYLGRQLYAVTGVEKVYISRETDNVDVWIIIPQRDTHIMEQISMVYGKIIELFSLTKRSPLLFDFHVIYRDGADDKDLISEKELFLLK